MSFEILDRGTCKAVGTLLLVDAPGNNVLSGSRGISAMVSLSPTSVRCTLIEPIAEAEFHALQGGMNESSITWVDETHFDIEGSPPDQVIHFAIFRIVGASVEAPAVGPLQLLGNVGFEVFAMAHSESLGRTVALGQPDQAAYSDDGGQTWTPAVLPALGEYCNRATWSAERGLFMAVVGNAGNSRCIRSADGITWEYAGPVVVAAAFYAVAFDPVAALWLRANALEGVSQIESSGDDGDTWTPRATADSCAMYGIACNPAGITIAVGYDTPEDLPLGYRATDGVTYAAEAMPYTLAPAVQTWSDVAWATRFVAVGYEGGPACVSDANGENFAEVALQDDFYNGVVGNSAGGVLALGEPRNADGAPMYSADAGLTWTPIPNVEASPAYWAGCWTGAHFIFANYLTGQILRLHPP